MAQESSGGIKIVTTNRKAYHDYSVEDKFEAGMALMGSEVKSIAEGKANLTDSYCQVENGELWVYGIHISPYDPASRFGHDPRRKRKLLMHKYEINRLRGKVEQKGFAIVPLKLYFRRGKAKLEIGLVKGKRQFDKRDTIKERDMQRDLERELQR
ncbi:MAG: SsrA-binding protein SmpB [Fimbriimonadia bacterium]|nr:SsrA-binding protein SmpB [Fimbriimonadia bacterium]